MRGGKRSQLRKQLRKSLPEAPTLEPRSRQNGGQEAAKRLLGDGWRQRWSPGVYFSCFRIGSRACTMLNRAELQSFSRTLSVLSVPLMCSVSLSCSVSACLLFSYRPQTARPPSGREPKKRQKNFAWCEKKAPWKAPQKRHLTSAKGATCSIIVQSRQK